MRKLILSRLASSLGVLALVSMVLFGLVQLSPIDPATLALGDAATSEQLAAKRQELGLDQPLPARYATWALAALRGDLGASLLNGEPVADAVLRRLPIALSLCGGAMLLALSIGLTVGLMAGLRPGSRADRIVTFAASLGLALPGFWLGLLFANAFAVQLRWFPVIGYTPLTENAFQWARGLILPCAALATHGAAVIARQMRGATIEALDSPFVQALRANGATERVIAWRFVARNALAPTLPIIGLQMSIIIAAAVVMERVFALPGVGSLLIDSIISNDLPMLQGGVLLIACAVSLIHLLVDIGIGLLDPRMRPA